MITAIKTSAKLQTVEGFFFPAMKNIALIVSRLSSKISGILKSKFKIFTTLPLYYSNIFYTAMLLRGEIT